MGTETFQNTLINILIIFIYLRTPYGDGNSQQMKELMPWQVRFIYVPLMGTETRLLSVNIIRISFIYVPLMGTETVISSLWFCLYHNLFTYPLWGRKPVQGDSFEYCCFWIYLRTPYGDGNQPQPSAVCSIFDLFTYPLWGRKHSCNHQVI